MKVRVVTSSRYTTWIRFACREDADPVEDFSGDEGEVCVRYDGGRTVVYAGLGSRDSVQPHVVRTVGARAVQAAQSLKRTRVAVDLRGLADGEEAAVEGVALGGYVFDKYLGEKPVTVERADLVSKTLSPSTARRIAAVCDSVCYARNLVNDNAEVVTPAYVASQARLIGRSDRVQVTVLDHRELKRRKLGLLAAVGRGSPTPPCLAVMRYQGAARSRATTAIVGKGITFDSGGMNLKPSGHIETMRIDMAGAAAVLGVMRALVATRARVNVIGVCAAAHNAIDGASYMPGDIIRSYSGKTVEICNTDAEGRLALADAIAYVRTEYKPDRIIDLATLTGGVLVAFADRLCGLFSNDDALADRLFLSGEQTHERMWRLPLYKEYCDAMKGDRSDLRNLATFKRGHASSITGAAFLKAFAEDTPWAHLDIAGTAFNEGEARGEIPKYATGYGVRMLMHYLTSEY